VGMMLTGETAPRRLDGRLAGVAGHPEDVVRIALGHVEKCIDAVRASGRPTISGMTSRRLGLTAALTVAPIAAWRFAQAYRARGRYPARHHAQHQPRDLR